MLLERDSRRSVALIGKFTTERQNTTIDVKERGRLSLILLAVAEKKRLDVSCRNGLFSLEAMKQGFEVDASEPADTERSIATQVTGIEPLACRFED